MASCLDGTEGGRDGLMALVDRALALRSGAAPSRRDGRRLAALFFNPSLRTRTSLESACAMLGVTPIALEPGKTSWAIELRDGVVMNEDKAEHISDALGALGAYVDLLAVRSFAGLVDAAEDRADPTLSAFVRHSPKPVLNLESALWHPLQGFADAATWTSRLGQELRGGPICLTWAPHPRALPAAVANQVLLTASLLGMDVRVAHPDGFDLDPEIVARAQGLASSAGGGVRVGSDRAALLDGARVVVAKSWSGFSGYGQRDAEAERRAGLASWTVTPEVMAATAGAGFMHCLPVRRNVVVTDAVIDGPASWVREEAALRLWTAAAWLEQALEA